jgi:hypothetical protein
MRARARQLILKRSSLVLQYLPKHARKHERVCARAAQVLALDAGKYKVRIQCAPVLKLDSNTGSKCVCV